METILFERQFIKDASSTKELVLVDTNPDYGRAEECEDGYYRETAVCDENDYYCGDEVEEEEEEEAPSPSPSPQPRAASVTCRCSSQDAEPALAAAEARHCQMMRAEIVVEMRNGANKQANRSI